MEQEFKFVTTGPFLPPPDQMTRVALEPDGEQSPDLESTGDSIHFLRRGWFLPE